MLVLLAGCGSGKPPVSGRGQALCRERASKVSEGFARDHVYGRCLASIEAELAAEDRAAALRREAALRRKLQAAKSGQHCRNQRRQLLALMASLRRTEAELAATKRDTYRSSSAPPPWDEDRESRYRLEDRELDRQRHEAAVAGWQSREAARRAAWEAGRRRRQDQAQQRLNQTARRLRQLEPDLFIAPGSIEFDAAVVRRLRTCGTEAPAAGPGGP